MQVESESPQSGRHKGTPARRQQHNRRSANSPAQKNYASENDVPHEFSPPVELGNFSPFTPQKTASKNSAPGSQPAHNKSKPRNGSSKPRPKNVSTSPGPATSGRTTPPHSAVPKSSTAATFAGATFHASPAPSSLPMPSFLTKAMDSPGLKTQDLAGQEPSPPATDSGAPTPQHSSAEPVSAESPLEVFFRAHRSEKERAHGGSTNSASSVPASPFRPVPQNRTPHSPVSPDPNSVATSQRHVSLPTRRRGLQRSVSGLSAAELNGTLGQPIGPAFSTPYQDRIRAARFLSDKQVSQVSSPLQQQQSNTPNTNRGVELMKYLHQASSTKPVKQDDRFACRGDVSSNRTIGSSGSESQQVSVTPTTLSGVTVTRSPDILRMEDDLRRVLKLDPAANLAAKTAARSNYTNP